eukprot:gene4879-5347_t
MGNLTSADLCKTEEDEDQNFLKLQNSAFFNDGFISSLAEKLPSYGLPETDEEKFLTNSLLEASDDHTLRLQKLISVLSHDPEMRNSKVEDLETLSLTSALATSGFHVMNAKRSKVLLRVFQAYNNYLRNFAGSAVKGGDSKYWNLPSVSSHNESSVSDQMTAVSICMTLSLAKALSGGNSALLASLLQTMLDTLSAFQPLSLFSTSPNLQASLQNVLQFAREWIEHDDLSVRSLSVSILLSLGLLMGSVSVVGETAQLLTEQPSLSLHASAVKLLRLCALIDPAFDISFPSNKFVTDKLVVAFQLDTAQISELKADPSLLSIAADAGHVYLYNGANKSLTKVGSGHNDSIPGDIVCTNKAIMREIWEQKEKSKEEKEELPDEVVAKLTVCNHKVLLRFADSKHSNWLAVIDVDTLLLDSLLDLSPQVLSYVLTDNNKVSREGDGKRIFNVDLTVCNSLFISAIDHHTISVASAVVDGLHDVTGLIRESLNGDRDLLFIADLLGQLSTVSLSFQPLVLTVEVLYEQEQNSAASLSLPITSIGNKVVTLLSTVVYSERPRAVDMLADLDIVSAYFDAENYKGPDIVKVVRECWFNYLKDFFEADAKKDDASLSNDDWNWKKLVNHMQSVTNNLFDEANKEIFINYRVNNDLNGTLIFNAKCNWSRLFDLVMDYFDDSEKKWSPVILDSSSFALVDTIKLEKDPKLPPDVDAYDLLFNSFQLVILSSEVCDDDGQKVVVSGEKYTLNGQQQQLFGSVFTKRTATATAFTYDITNNLIWGYDIFSSSLVKWRNAGMAPVILPDSKNELLTRSATERLQQFVEEGKVGPALWALLEKLSEPYGCSFRNILGENMPEYAIKVSAKVSEEGGDKYKCSIIHNGIPIVFDDDLANECVGYHVAVFTPQGKLYRSYLFDNDNEQGATDQLLYFIHSIPQGYIVCIANCNCIHDSMTRTAYESLMTIGLIDIEVLEEGPVELKGFICVGVKGLSPGQAELATIYIPGTISINRLLPPFSVPLALEPEILSLKKLMNVVIRAYKMANQGGDREESLSSLCSSFKVLQAQLFHLISQSDSEKWIKEIAESLEELKDILLEVIRSSWMNQAYMEEAVLSLFTSSFGLFFRAQSQQVSFFTEKASAFEQNMLSGSEEKVLEILLKRYRDPNVLLFVENKVINYSYAKRIFDATVSIINTYTERSRSELSGSGQSILGAAVALLFSLTKLLLACDSEHIILPSDGNAKQPSKHAGDGEMIFDIIFRLSSLAAHLLSLALKDVENASESKDVVAVLNGLRASPVGSVLPLAIICLSGMVTKGSYSLLSKSLENLVSIIDALSLCSLTVGKILSSPTIPSDRCEYDNSISKRTSAIKVCESEHPYRSNMDETTLISFPGALSVIITFDAVSRTEHECDYIQFRDNNDEDLHEGRFSGRDGNVNFPGVGTVPPLVIQRDSFKVYFHSDGSVEDWGYKFTAQAVFPPQQTDINRQNWLLKLNFEIGRVLCNIGSVLMRGPEKKQDLEVKYAHYMENSLVRPELFSFQEQSLGSEDNFLQNLIYRNGNELSDKFIRIMKSKVMEDRGSVEAINNAVYATCAAILKANNLVKEAVALATGLRSECSPALIKAWKAGQKMRAYFDLKDLRADISNNLSDSYDKSLYAGADSEVVNNAAEKVISRAQFLLRTPTFEDNLLEESSESVSNVGDEQADSTLSPQAKSPYSLQLSANSPKGGDSGQARWRLAARAVALQRQISDDTRNVATMWHSLVDEAVVVDKLKNTLMYRRKLAERHRTGKQLTPTEKVLQFIQSDVDVAKLHEMNNIRTKRAILRAKGVLVFKKLFEAPIYHPFSIFVASTSFFQAMQLIKREDGSQSGAIHYANDLEGCSPVQQTVLYQQYQELLKSFVNILVAAMEKLVNPSVVENKPLWRFWKDGLLSTISVCALDYDYSDHGLVLESGLIDALENLLRSELDGEILSKSRALLEILVGKFLVLDTHSEVVVEPTELSKKLVQLLSSLLVSAAGSARKIPRYVLSNLSFENQAEKIAVEDSIRVQNYGLSYRLPAFELHADHSFSFWLQRPFSKILDGKLEPRDYAGLQVIRGPAWKVEEKPQDGGFGTIGTISTYDYDNRKVLVQWKGNSKEYEYKFDPENRNVNEVVLVDDRIGGFLFSRSSSDFNDAVDSRTLPFFQSISALILPDATLLFIYRPTSKDPVLFRSKTALTANSWSHVVFACDVHFLARLFVNGELDRSQSLGTVDIGTGLTVIESVHPLDQQEAVEQEIELQDVVEGQEQIIWASDKNSFSASQGALAVPGNKIKFRYCPVEDSTPREEWGYQLSVGGISDKLNKQLTHVSPKMPLYLGHLPSFVSSPLKSFVHGFEGLLSHFRVFNNSMTDVDVGELLNKEIEKVKDQGDFLDEVGIISVFGILRKAVDSLDSLSDSSLRRAFASSGLLDVLMEVLHTGSTAIKCAAYNIATALFPPMDVEMIDGLALRHGLLDDSSLRSKSFLGYLVSSIGAALNKIARREAACAFSPSQQVKEPSLDEVSIVAAQVKLLREFASGHDVWVSEINRLVQELLVESRNNLALLVKLKDKEMDVSFAESLIWAKHSSVSHLHAGDQILTLLAFFGYDISGLYPGSAVLYFDPKTGVSEEAVVIGFTRPPMVAPDPKGKNLELLDKWDSAGGAYGEVIAIALRSSPQVVTVVPRNQVKPHIVDKLATKFEEYLANHIGLDVVVKLFQEIASVDILDRRTKPVAITKVDEKVLTFESEHPYADNMDVYEDISIPGADEMIVTFDENSLTETNCDFVQFYKTSARTEIHGTRYWGRQGDENFPGSGGRPPLVIPSSFAVMHFHSDGSNTDWGYKFTVTAKVKVVIEPPNMPPLPAFSLLAQIKMTAMKALYRLVETSSQVATQMTPIFSAIFQSAVAPRPYNRVHSAVGTAVKQLVFESNHPYEDNLDVTTPVSIQGAKRYVINFDPETRTENNCDHLSFYLDEGRSTRVTGSEQYTGGKDGSNSNWPGFGGRPPLVIEADKFYIFFHSDGSVNDWGWRCFVTAEVASNGEKGPLVTRGQGMDAVAAETSAIVLQNLVADGIPHVSPSLYKSINKFIFEKSPAFSTYRVHADKYTVKEIGMLESKEEVSVCETKTMDQEANYYLTVERVNNGANTPTCNMVVVLAAEAELRASPSNESDVLGTVRKDQTLFVLRRESEWVRVAANSDTKEDSFGEDSGWLLTRNEDCFVVEFIEQTKFVTPVLHTNESPKASHVENNSSKDAGKKPLNPMYALEDTVAGPSTSKASFVPLSAPVLLLQQDEQFIDAAICDYSLLAGILYANDLVSSLVKRWPSDIPFTVAQFGSLDSLLTYLNTSLASQNGGDRKAKEDLESIMDLLLGRKGEQSSANVSTPLQMLSFAVSVLEQEIARSDGGASPSTLVIRGESRTFETMHPYDNNMNFDWRFSFPGAKRLEISFDPRSTTETNYDFVSIYDASKNEMIYKQKITGFTNASNRHWPGVNAPKVVLPGVDSCIINFQSDGGTNDWGFAGTVNAVFEEPTKEQLAAEEERLAAVQYQDCTSLACWILFSISSRENLAHDVAQVLFTAANFRVIMAFFKQASASAKNVLIDLFVVFTRELLKLPSQLVELKSDMMDLEQNLREYAQQLFTEDTEDGVNNLTASSTLQSVLQLLVSLDTVLFAIQNDSELLEYSGRVKVELSKTDDQTLVHFPLASDKLVVRWDVRLERLAGAVPHVGLTSARPTLADDDFGRNNGDLLVTWKQSELYISANQKFGVSFGEAAKTLVVGDVVSVIYDRSVGSIAFLVNGSFVGTAVGSAILLPAVEMNIKGLPLSLVVKLASPDDLVSVYMSSGMGNGVVAPKSTTNAPKSGQLNVIDDLYHLRSLLSSISEQQIPRVVLSNRLLPYASKKHLLAFSWSNEDLSDHKVIERDIDYPGARCVTLALQNLKLERNDRLEIVDCEGHVLTQLSGPIDDMKFNANVDSLIVSQHRKDCDDRGRRLTRDQDKVSSKSVNVGDRVQRGTDWRYGSEDGGIGSEGTVVKVRNWKDFSSGGAVVKWDNGFERLYRVDCEGLWDVVKVPEREESSNAKLAEHGLWWTNQTCIKLRLHLSDDIDGQGDRKLQGVVFPQYPISHCLSDPVCDSFVKHLRSLYVCSNRASLAALVKHVNGVARERNWSREDLLNQKYKAVAPGKEDLIRSPALKELVESVVFDLDESELDVIAEGADLGNDACETSSVHGDVVWSEAHSGFTLEGLAHWAGINDFATEEEARMAAEQVEDCSGFVSTGNVFSLRTGSTLVPSSPSDTCWLLTRRQCTSSGVLKVPEMEQSDGDSDEESDEVAEEDVWVSMSEGEEEESEGDEEEQEEEEERDTEDEYDDEEEATLEDEDTESSSVPSSNSSAHVIRQSVSNGGASSPSRAASESRAVFPPQCGKCHKTCRRHPAGTWHNGWICDWPDHQGENSFTAADHVYGCENIIPCNWGICEKCWARIKKAAGARCDPAQLANASVKGESSLVACQFLLLQQMNTVLVHVLPFIDLRKSNSLPGSLAALVCANRDLIFEPVKSAVFNEVLNSTTVSGGMFDLPLSRFRARRNIQAGKVDTEGRWSVFAQAFRILHSMSPRSLRRNDRLYNTKFLGEHAQDAGGPYRESFDTYTSELQSPALPLLLRTPNGRHAVGQNREKFILHPNATTSTQLSMLSFLGQLMGVAVRTKDFLALNFPPFVWKLLSGATPTVEDLEGIDYSLVASLRQLRDIAMDAETFAQTFFETFTTLSSDDRVVPLLPKGDQLDVTLENRQEYIDLVFQYRLHEFDLQAAAVRTGLASILPLHLLNLYTADELEEMVCGKADIDVDLLERVAEYSGCSPSDPHVRNFWELLSSFDNNERSAFLRFTWGRSRLPLTAATFTQRFKIQSFNKSGSPDSYFPVAHTCFFSIELPRYSSIEIMRERLLYAIFNCEAIDGDDTATGIAVAAMGWEDQDQDEE